MGYCIRFGKFLSFHEEGEVVTTIIGMVHLSDLNSIIGQEVMDDEGQVVKASEETENSAVVVKELLL